MSTIAHDAGLRTASLGSAFRSALNAVGRALGSYSVYRAERAAASADLQHMDEEISRYRQLIRAAR